MPVECELGVGILLVRTIGLYTNEELKDAVARVAASPTFPQGTRLLFDGSRSEAPLSPPDIDWRVRWLGSLPRQGFSATMAAVVRGDEVFRYGLGRQLSMRLEAEGVNIRLFADLAAARQWLAAAGDAPPAG